MNEDRETHRHAITAFVWAVLSLAGALIIGPIIAFVYAGKARRAVAAHPTEYKGRELSESASSIATAALVFQLLFIGVIAAAVVAGGLGVDALSGATPSRPTPPPISQSEFTLACTSHGGTETQCGCIFSHLAASVDEADIQRATLSYVAGTGLPDDLGQWVDACRTGA